MSEQVSRQRLWQRRQSAAGRCQRCGQPSHLRHCLDCRVKIAERKRAKLGKPFELATWKGRHYTK